ncbi:MAG TPA: L,D-transpeptidase, partial [Myxococcota bacterium]|nr:L,D-transpeptidase [Myxococcota bacterium]
VSVPLPATFFATHPSTPVPQAEPTLVLIQHDSYTMRIYKNGSLSGTYNVSFGQEAGVKERRGDNRTPKGVYYVIARSLGPFDGPYGEYYGGHWIKLNYPNAYDAARGVDQGLITPAQQVSISRAWRARQPTLRDTALGGGIGLHGWAREWEDDGPRHLSWGCVVLHLEDVGEVYDSIPQSAMVILF